MYTAIFVLMAFAAALVGLMSNEPAAMALFAVFALLSFFSFIFDLCTRRERALEDEEEEDAYSVRHYFD